MATSSNFYHNRVFAVAGGGSGIGFATVKQLLSLGARVSLADYRLSDSLVSDLSGNESKLFLANVDVTNPRACEQWIKDTVDRWGRLDGAANLAGSVLGFCSMIDI